MIPKTIATAVAAILVTSGIASAQAIYVSPAPVFVNPPSVTWAPPTQYPPGTYTQYPYVYPYTDYWTGGYGPPYGYAVPYRGFGRYRESYKVRVR